MDSRCIYLLPEQLYVRSYVSHNITFLKEFVHILKHVVVEGCVFTARVILTVQCVYVVELHLRQITSPLHPITHILHFLTTHIYTFSVFPQPSQTLIKHFNDLKGRVIHSDRLKVEITSGRASFRILRYHRLHIIFIKHILVPNSIIVQHYSNNGQILLPDFLIKMRVIIGSQHVEENVDCQYGIAHSMVEGGFFCLAHVFVILVEF